MLLTTRSMVFDVEIIIAAATDDQSLGRKNNLNLFELHRYRDEPNVITSARSDFYKLPIST